MHASYSRYPSVGCLALTLLLSACAARAPAVSAADARDDPRSKPYVIGPSDVVRITVWKNPELSAEAVVRPPMRI